MEKVRQYVPTLRQLTDIEATGYGEIDYIDRFTDGTPAGEGTEDFSWGRWAAVNNRRTRSVYRPTGELDKGGHRRWERVNCITARSVRECGIIARLLYAGQEISIRKY